MNFLNKYKYCFLFGLLAGLSFPPFYLIIFLPISFYYIINKINTLNNYKDIFKYSLIFGFSYYLIQLYWISFSLFVDIKSYFWLFPFALTLIPLACAFFIALTGILTKYLITKFKIKNKFLITLIFAFSYVIFEYLKGLIFPWNLFAYTLGFSNTLIQFVSIINIYTFNFVLIVFFCGGYVLYDFKNKKIINKQYIIIYILIFLTIFLFGFFRLKYAKQITLNKSFRLVQANIKQSAKWDILEAQNNIQKHLDLTWQDGLENIDFIIWSESSIPFLITNDIELPENFKLKDKILISGGVRGKVENDELKQVWNSIFIFQNNKILDYYDKTILVPFGEYIPFKKFLPFIGKITNGAIDFSKGKQNKTIEINGLKISPIVCYEVIFPDRIIDKNNKPDIIINLTNDGWFGISSGPYQHLVATKFRAIENNLPIIRVSNSGITAYIDNYGRVIKKINLHKVGFLDTNI